MRAYVLCQMDYSSPVFPVMDGPLKQFMKHLSEKKVDIKLMILL